LNDEIAEKSGYAVGLDCELFSVSLGCQLATLDLDLRKAASRRGVPTAGLQVNVRHCQH